MSTAKRKANSSRVMQYKTQGKGKKSGTFAGLTPKQRKRSTKKSGSMQLFKTYGPSKKGR